MDNKERFFEKVRRPNDCWLWMGGVDRKTGYGWFWLDGKNVLAHRAAWVFFNGPIFEHLQVLHRCDVQICVNPEHLYLGTAKDNMRDRDERGRHWTQSGERHYASKLTNGQVDEIRARWPQEGSRALSIEYEVGMGYIWRIATGRVRANE